MMDPSTAQGDLAFIKDIVQATSRRIDAHAFHCVHWGLIILVWYPLGNWLWLGGRVEAYTITGVAAFVLGAVLSIGRGIRAARRPRVPAGNTVISRQLATIAFANVLAGTVISAVAPAAGFIDGENVPIIWGLVYANMAFMMGVAYSRDFMISGVAIFVGGILAMAFQAYAGYILGPFMGLGMLIPGLRAEARVRRLAADTNEHPGA